MTVRELMQIFGNLNPGTEVRVKFKEQNAQKTIEFEAVEIKDNGVVIHGHVVCEVYSLIDEVEQYYALIIAENIRKRGEVFKAIKDTLC